MGQCPGMGQQDNGIFLHDIPLTDCLVCAYIYILYAILLRIRAIIVSLCTKMQLQPDYWHSEPINNDRMKQAHPSAKFDFRHESTPIVPSIRYPDSLRYYFFSAIQGGQKGLNQFVSAILMGCHFGWVKLVNCRYMQIVDRYIVYSYNQQVFGVKIKLPKHLTLNGIGEYLCISLKSGYVFVLWE